MGILEPMLNKLKVHSFASSLGFPEVLINYSNIILILYHNSINIDIISDSDQY